MNVLALSASLPTGKLQHAFPQRSLLCYCSRSGVLNDNGTTIAREL